MNAIQVTVWLEQPKYEALKRCLGSMTEVEKAAQVRLDQLYEQTVPLEEREMISERIAQMRQEEVRREAAARRVMGYRIMEGGREVCFEMEHGYDVLRLAQRLRSYQRGELFACGSDFYSSFGRCGELDYREYAALSGSFLRGDEQVEAMFDINIDGGNLAILDRDSGRREYAISDISTAAFHAFRKAHIPDRRRSEIFWSKLEGKELTPAPRLLMVDVHFDEEIMEIEGKLNFYIRTDFDVDAVLGTSVEKVENDDWLNVCANYDLATGQVCDRLDIELHRGDGSDQELSYSLQAAETEMLMRKMDAYCQQQTGMTLDAYRAQLIAGDQGMGMEPRM